MTTQDIYTKLAALPDSLKKEVNDFIEFLSAKNDITEKKADRRKAGLARGLISIKNGFDDPLDDFKEYM